MNQVNDWAIIFSSGMRKKKRQVGVELHPRPNEGSKWKLYYSLLELDFKSISHLTTFKDFTLGCSVLELCKHMVKDSPCPSELNSLLGFPTAMPLCSSPLLLSRMKALPPPPDYFSRPLVSTWNEPSRLCRQHYNPFKAHLAGFPEKQDTVV